MIQEWEGYDIRTFVSKYLIYKITLYIKACSLKKSLYGWNEFSYLRSSNIFSSFPNFIPLMKPRRYVLCGNHEMYYASPCNNGMRNVSSVITKSLVFLRYEWKYFWMSWLYILGLNKMIIRFTESNSFSLSEHLK